MGQHIHIHVIPNAGETRIGVRDNRITVWLKAKPEKGKANKEFLNFLKKLTKKKAHLVMGETSTDKVVEIEGLNEESFKELASSSAQGLQD